MVTQDGPHDVDSLNPHVGELQTLDKHVQSKILQITEPRSNSEQDDLYGMVPQIRTPKSESTGIPSAAQCLLFSRHGTSLPTDVHTTSPSGAAPVVPHFRHPSRTALALSDHGSGREPTCLVV